MSKKKLAYLSICCSPSPSFTASSLASTYIWHVDCICCSRMLTLPDSLVEKTVFHVKGKLCAVEIWYTCRAYVSLAHKNFILPQFSTTKIKVFRNLQGLPLYTVALSIKAIIRVVVTMSSLAWVVSINMRFQVIICCCFNFFFLIFYIKILWLEMFTWRVSSLV